MCETCTITKFEERIYFHVGVSHLYHKVHELLTHVALADWHVAFTGDLP